MQVKFLPINWWLMTTYHSSGYLVIPTVSTAAPAQTQKSHMCSCDIWVPSCHHLRWTNLWPQIQYTLLLRLWCEHSIRWEGGSSVMHLRGRAQTGRGPSRFRCVPQLLSTPQVPGCPGWPTSSPLNRLQAARSAGGRGHVVNVKGQRSALQQWGAD